MLYESYQYAMQFGRNRDGNIGGELFFICIVYIQDVVLSTFGM